MPLCGHPPMPRVARLQQGLRTGHVRTTDVLHGLDEAMVVRGWPP